MSSPSPVDIGIVGAGLIGLLAARELALRGWSVALFDRAAAGAAQSSRNWGWCRTLARAPDDLPLAIESLKLWQDLAQRLDGETGFRRTGTVYAFDTQRALHTRRAWVAQQASHGLQAQLCDGTALAALLPGAARRWAGGVYSAVDGRAEPARAVAAALDAARSAGVRIYEHHPVQAIGTRSGAVCHIETGQGLFACRRALITAGTGSRWLCRTVGVDLPQLSVRASVARTAPVPGLPEVSLAAEQFGLSRRADGGYTLAARGRHDYEIVPDSLRLLPDFAPRYLQLRKEIRPVFNRRVFWHELRQIRATRAGGRLAAGPSDEADPPPLRRSLARGWQAAVAAFPALATAGIVETWAGQIDVTPDGLPIIGALPRIDGLFVATGFSGHGFGVAPGAGRLAADLVSGTPPLVSPAPYRPERFARIVRFAA